MFTPTLCVCFPIILDVVAFFVLIFSFFFFLSYADMWLKIHLCWPEMNEKRKAPTNLHTLNLNKCVCLWVWFSVRTKSNAAILRCQGNLFTQQLVCLCVACLNQNLFPKLPAVAYTIRERVGTCGHRNPQLFH